MKMPATIVARLTVLVGIGMASLIVPSMLYTGPSIPQQTSSYGSNFMLQETLTEVVTSAVNNSQAARGCALVLDANTGRIVAATSYRSSSTKANISDMVTQAAWEPGSIMKPLLVATAINETTVDVNNTRFTNKDTYIGKYHITNAIEYTKPSFGIQDILTHSINTGAIKVFLSLGKSDTVNNKSRQTWHSYLKNNYRFGQPTGIHVASEARGYVPPPTGTPNINNRYANTAIGQGLTVTPIQIAAAYAAVLNGGTYYKPYIGTPLIGGPIIVQRNIVTPETSRVMRQMLSTSIVANMSLNLPLNYEVGGKSGTAHSAGAAGDYSTGKDNGTFIGYVKNDQQVLIVLLRLDEPSIDTFAGQTAGKAWKLLVEQLFTIQK